LFDVYSYNFDISKKLDILIADDKRGSKIKLFNLSKQNKEGINI